MAIDTPSTLFGCACGFFNAADLQSGGKARLLAENNFLNKLAVMGSNALP